MKVFHLTSCLAVVVLASCGSRDPRPPDSTAFIALRHLQKIETDYYGRHQRYGTVRDLKGSIGAENDFLTRIEHGIDGYIFELQARADSYDVRVRPQRWGEPWKRSFYSDETLIIRHAWDETPADKDSNPVFVPE